MDKKHPIETLKALLRREVAEFCRHDKGRWKSEIPKTIDEIKANNWPAVFFGGTLRSLLISRITNKLIGRPRDIDIVITGIEVEDLKRQFASHIHRTTRFGGLQLWRKNWQFDVWPLQHTYALSSHKPTELSFRDLPNSTFLNLEAVAIDVWARPGRPRMIYSGNDQFFEGILSRTVELNYERNPYPELCVARALIIASSLQWKIGPRLLDYIVTHGSRVSGADFENVQRKHYGRIRLKADGFKNVLEYISNHIAGAPSEAVALPLPKQLTFWPEKERDRTSLHFFTIPFQPQSDLSMQSSTHTTSAQ